MSVACVETWLPLMAPVELVEDASERAISTWEASGGHVDLVAVVDGHSVSIQPCVGFKVHRYIPELTCMRKEYVEYV